MNNNFKAELANIDRQSQRQDGANDQMLDLYKFAIALGMKDAADSANILTSKENSLGMDMPKNLQQILGKVTQQTQRQDSVSHQMHDLRLLANRLGLYDASDILKNLVQHKIAARPSYNYMSL